MKPSRKTTVNTVEEHDDYASMQEVVGARCTAHDRGRLTSRPHYYYQWRKGSNGRSQRGSCNKYAWIFLSQDWPSNRPHSQQTLFGFPPQTIALPPESEPSYDARYRMRCTDTPSPSIATSAANMLFTPIRRYQIGPKLTLSKFEHKKWRNNPLNNFQEQAS